MRRLLRSVFVEVVVVITVPFAPFVLWSGVGDSSEAWVLARSWCWWIACSRRTHVRSVEQKVKKNRPSYEIVSKTKQGEKVKKMTTKRWR